MDVWNLQVELDGEREQCDFPSPEDAECAWQMLLADYGVRLSKAKLISPAGKVIKTRVVRHPGGRGALHSAKNLLQSS